MTKWILTAALLGQPSVSTQVEEIYVVRSVPEALLMPPTGFCAQERIGFGGIILEGRFTFRSTATQPSDGRMVDANVATVGSIHICSGPSGAYAEGVLVSASFKGIGECRVVKFDFPEPGIVTGTCSFDLSGLSGTYVGGLITTNTLTFASGRVGLETDPPGYTQNSIATIRLWRKRDASSSAMAQTKSSSQVEVSKESLVGTWKLVSATYTDGGGQMHQNAWGLDPTGFLTYTADDRVSVVIAYDGRKPLPRVPTSQQAAEAFGTINAYAGTYTFIGNKVVHHIEVAWVQNFVNTDQVRSVKLEGDRLTLRGGWRVEGMPTDPGSTEIVWERLKPETAGK